MSGKRVMKSSHKKPVALIVSLVLVLTAVLGVTIAYLTAETNQVKNTFTPGEVTCVVVEPGFTQGTSTVKQNVTIKNTGDTAAYIRAAIVVTWQKADGTVYAKAPVKGSDYTLTLGSDWTEQAGYYYYNEGAVAADSGETSALISECKVTGAAPADDYTLHVEILAQAIQSSPDDAVKAAWGENALSWVGGAN